MSQPAALTRVVPSDLRDHYIERVVEGRSFCDVGGLWGTVKEKVSIAAREGASEITMIDITPPDRPLWGRLQDRLDGLGVSHCQFVSASIDDPSLGDRLPRYGVVHCSGVLYHCPNPLYTVSQLARISERHVIITSIVVPPELETETGSLSIPDGQALFVPHLPERTRQILAEYWRDSGIDNAKGIHLPVERWDVSDYGPWWWLFTSATFRSLVSAAGLIVRDEGSLWGGRSYAILAEHAPSTSTS